MEPIKLRKVGEQEPKKLPRGVRLMTIGDQAMFVRQSGKHVVPVSQEEQKRLRQEYCGD
jgi:hypothetical protein